MAMGGPAGRRTHFLLFHSLVLGAVAQIRVLAPQTLASEFTAFSEVGWIMGSTSTFGAPFYGDRFLGRLTYGYSKLNQHHCTADDYDVAAPEESHDARTLHVVIVRRGGNCSLTAKVRIAQEKGAHAVIIVDLQDSKYTAEDMQNIVVTDDGYGDTVHIPSVFISKDDGQKLINGVASSPVYVELMWKVPVDTVVKFDWWMSSASAESYRLLKQFAPKRRALNQVLSFQPHYSVFGVSSQQAVMMRHLCLDEQGEICAEDPDGSGPVSGADVLAENARQLCIHDVHKMPQDSLRMDASGGVHYAEKFWDYVERFNDQCPLDGGSADTRFGIQCSVNLMNQVGVDVNKVDKCVRENAAKFLRRERDNPAWSSRALRINGWRYSGVLDADLITKAICSGFVKTPVECESLVKKRDPFKPYVVTQVEGLSFSAMREFFLLFVSIIIMSMFLYRRHAEKQMHSAVREEVMLEVQAQMGQYVKMGAKA
jgi:hypothetical protein